MLKSQMLEKMSAESPTLPWDKFNNWLHCICVVTFDLELGQAIEALYPPHAKISDQERSNICYLSFPDSNSGCMGDFQYHYRIRQSTSHRTLPPVLKYYNSECPHSLQVDDGYLYGYVFFRQTKDKSIRRGYFQKSLVLISLLPFQALFHYLAGVIATEYFSHGEPGLEAACHNVDQWPSPLPGQTLSLPLMGTVIQVRVPSRSDKLLNNSPVQPSLPPQVPANHILPSAHENDLFTVFQPVVNHVQLLWELVLTGEPLVVMASSPDVSSQAVHALVQTIWPLQYCCDHRPYFTIHDSEFKEYTTRTQGPPSVLLGVTNPFFAKTLQHWPHIVRIGEMDDFTAAKGKVKKAGNLKTLDTAPGVYTRYKPFLATDKALLKRLLKGVQVARPAQAQCALLRRHLLELTQSFMIPLERYLGSLMPLARNVSAHRSAPLLRDFNMAEFERTLDGSGPELTCNVRGDWLGLYRKFFRSANFRGWLDQRQKEANRALQALHVEKLCQEDLVNWVHGRHEVEVVDLVLRLRDKVKRARSREIPVSAEILERLHDTLNSVVASLPEDLQLVLRSN